MAANEHSLQYITGNSILHRIYPLVKLAWVLTVAVGLFVYKEPLSGLVMFILVLILAVTMGGIPFMTIFRSAKTIFMLGLLLMFFHFFADPGNSVYQLGPLTITDGGLKQGPIFFFRLSVVVLASFVLIWTTDSRDLMVSITHIGVSYRYAFAVFLAMRFLPLIQREVEAVKMAHAIRGRAAQSPLLHRFRLWQRYMFTILINGLRKAEITATALDSRGFGTYPTRTYVKNVKFSVADLWLVVVFALITAGLLYLETQISFMPGAGEISAVNLLMGI